MVSTSKQPSSPFRFLRKKKTKITIAKKECRRPAHLPERPQVEPHGDEGEDEQEDEDAGPLVAVAGVAVGVLENLQK